MGCTQIKGESKCKNYLLCRSILPFTKGQHYYKNNLCETCGSWYEISGFGWDQLEFESKNNESCTICNKTSKIYVKFPTNCGHWFCVRCTRDACLPTMKLHLSPETYGCPPCPNGCDNPEKGNQCYCEEYDVVKEKWKTDFPLNFLEWDENQFSSLTSVRVNIEYGSCTCPLPLCKKVYQRKLSRFGSECD